MNANDALAADERNVDVPRRPTLRHKVLQQPRRADARDPRLVRYGLLAVHCGIDHELDELLEALDLIVDETLPRATPPTELARVVEHLPFSFLFELFLPLTLFSFLFSSFS